MTTLKASGNSIVIKVIPETMHVSTVTYPDWACQRKGDTMTEQTKHTPGPWYSSLGSMGQGLIISEADGRTVAVAYDEGDAPLIAAAPELLRALEDARTYILDVCEATHGDGDHDISDYDLLNDVETAIAKAKGKTA